MSCFQRPEKFSGRFFCFYVKIDNDIIATI